MKAGKARYIGASSMCAWQFAKALAASERHGWARFVSMQDHYNLLYREEEREMLPLCAAEGIGVIPWSPLARGRLARPWDAETARTETDEFGKTLYRDEDEQIVDRGRSRWPSASASRAQVALAWLLANPAVTAPIVGVTKPEHLDDAVAAVDLELTDEDVAALEEPYRPTRSPATSSEPGRHPGVRRRAPLDAAPPAPGSLDWVQRGGGSSVGRALACGASGRGFEPRSPPLFRSAADAHPVGPRLVLPRRQGERVRIGCSGWSYDEWRGGLYPEGLLMRRWWSNVVYAEELSRTVEVNATFYRLPKGGDGAGVVRGGAGDFLVRGEVESVPTHMKRLRDIGDGVARFWEPLEPLRRSGRLGPALVAAAGRA